MDSDMDHCAKGSTEPCRVHRSYLNSPHLPSPASLPWPDYAVLIAITCVAHIQWILPFNRCHRAIKRQQCEAGIRQRQQLTQKATRWRCTRDWRREKKHLGVTEESPNPSFPEPPPQRCRSFVLFSSFFRGHCTQWLCIFWVLLKTWSTAEFVFCFNANRCYEVSC